MYLMRLPLSSHNSRRFTTRSITEPYMRRICIFGLFKKFVYRLEEVRLEKLPQLGNRGLPKTLFTDLKNLSTLVIKACSLLFVPSEALQSVERSVQELDLSNNPITLLRSNDFSVSLVFPLRVFTPTVIWGIDYLYLKNTWRCLVSRRIIYIRLTSYMVSNSLLWKDAFRQLECIKCIAKIWFYFKLVFDFVND